MRFNHANGNEDVKKTLGSLSNYDDDENDNFKKTIDLIIRTTGLHVHEAFYYI